AQHYSRPLDGCGSIRSLCPCVQHFRSALAALYVDGFRAHGGVGCCYLSRQLARVLEVVTLDTRGAYGSDFRYPRNVFRFSSPLGALARIGGCVGRGYAGISLRSSVLAGATIVLPGIVSRQCRCRGATLLRGRAGWALHHPLERMVVCFQRVSAHGGRSVVHHCALVLSPSSLTAHRQSRGENQRGLAASLGIWAVGSCRFHRLLGPGLHLLSPAD